MSFELAGSLDTNVIVRLLTGDIKHQKQLGLDLIKFKNFLIIDVAIIETIYALNTYYKVPRDKIPVAINQLQSNPHLYYSHGVFNQVLDLYVAHPALSIEDCYLAVKANHRSASPLWTFDKKLAKQAPDLVKLIS